MTFREEFTKTTAGAMAGIAFTGCDLLSAARFRTQAQARPAPRGKGRARPIGRRLEAVATRRRREVVVGGRRVKTIDVHAHCVIPEALALLGLTLEGQRGPGMEEVGPRRMREMDAQGIDMEALSIKGNGWLANTIGNPLDTTIALSHLIFEGTLDRFPGLKICSAHGGGYLPSYAPRSDNSLRVAPDMDTGVKLKKKPTEYLRRMYYDTLVFTSEALRHLAAEVGSSQLVLGTDHPIPWQAKSVDHILKAPGFTDAERRAMLGGTAARLLGIKP
jgi:hypothetical protein